MLSRKCWPALALQSPVNPFYICSTYIKWDMSMNTQRFIYLTHCLEIEFRSWVCKVLDKPWLLHRTLCWEFSVSMRLWRPVCPNTYRMKTPSKTTCSRWREEISDCTSIVEQIFPSKRTLEKSRVKRELTCRNSHARKLNLGQGSDTWTEGKYLWLIDRKIPRS